MRILVVEDEAKIARFLKSSLEAEYYAVDTAENGERGSFFARTNDYDLVILDNILPEKNGLEVCREIRAHGKTMPILVLSVKTDTAQKRDLLDAGADDYLTKPFALEELLARVRALLRRPAVIDKDVFTIGNLTLDATKYLVTCDTKTLTLTRKEFMLLHYLMQHEGTVLTRAMLLEHVWDMSVDIFSNTIESHIFSLRKKIGDGEAHEIIQTVPGRGYKIES